MLLNEVQRQRSKIEAQAAINSTQAQEYAALAKRSAAEESQLRSLQRQLADVHAVLVKLEAKDKDELVARR
jgi:predicted  nucleic acid-binding Zn-ribbon protein